MSNIFLLLTLSFLSILFFPPHLYASSSGDAYEVLKDYNYPVGLLPTGVEGYHLNRCTGKFAVYLTEKCHFSSEFYPLKFEKTITGILSKNRISDIQGFQAKTFFGWYEFDEVVRSDDSIVIRSGGLFGMKFPMERFGISPGCACGFRCENSAPPSAGSAVKVEEKMGAAGTEDSGKHAIAPSSQPWSPAQDVNTSTLMAQLEEVSKQLQRINEARLNITLLYEEVMKVRDFDEQTLLRAFDHLSKNENSGMAFLAKTDKHRTIAVEAFCSKEDEEEEEDGY